MSEQMTPETIAALKAKAWAESKMFPEEPPYSGAWNFGADDMARAMLPEIERLEAIEKRFKELHVDNLCKCGEQTPLYFKLDYSPGHSRSVCSPALVAVESHPTTEEQTNG